MQFFVMFAEKKRSLRNIFVQIKNNGMFGSLEREESRGEKSRGEWLFFTLFRCF